MALYSISREFYAIYPSPFGRAAAMALGVGPVVAAFGQSGHAGIVVMWFNIMTMRAPTRACVRCI